VVKCTILVQTQEIMQQAREN